MPVNGIKVPQYDENGKRLMLLEAAVAKKVNAQIVDMQSRRRSLTSKPASSRVMTPPRSTARILKSLATVSSSTLRPASERCAAM
jgi:hypothetical protein